jgi:hypothetical protein
MDFSQGSEINTLPDQYMTPDESIIILRESSSLDRRYGSTNFVFLGFIPKCINTV